MPLRFRPEVLKRARVEQGRSRDHLARLAGVSRVTVYNVERGISAEPRPAIVKALADALGVPVAELYEEFDLDGAA